MSLEEQQKKQGIVRKVGPYILGETLGKGGYSWVKRGVSEKKKDPVALKFMVREDKTFVKKQGNQVDTEIKCMSRIKNPHVVKLYTYNLHCKYPDKCGKILNTILLVMEYCPGGELFDILYYTSRLDPVTARTYFVQMLQGLKACHDSGVVHRDIKPQNLLLDENYQLKITDFGLSFVSKEQNLENVLLKTRCGTRGYQAPELLKGEKYTKACDIFSCGVVLFILLTGYPPFEQAWREDKWYKPLCESNPEAFWRAHTSAKLDADCRNLIIGMLLYRARNRLTLEECLQHKWVVGQKIHTPMQLADVVKEKHRETRKLRRNDKKRMQDLDNSVKERKKRIICKCLLNEDAKEFRDSRCSCCNGVNDVSRFQVELPVVENFVTTLMTFFALKSKLNEAYDAAVNVFHVALEGKSQTTFSSGNPWNVRTLVKVSDGVSEQELAVALYVREIKKSGIVAFKFKRLQGDSIAFARIWDAAEECLMTYSESVFFDVLEEKFKTVEENKEDE